MAVRTMALIVNPMGGLKSGLDIFHRVKPILEAGGYELDVIETRYAGHARDIARSIDLEPYEGICAIGGDGTMHEVLNGLMARADGKMIPLGLIPGGTGNSLMHDLDCLDPVEAAKIIVQGHTRKIDAAKVQMDHKVVYAFNIIGWGLVTDLNVRAENVRWMGETRYTYAAVMEIMKARKRHVKLIVEGEEFDQDFIFILGSITKFAGKGMMMGPKAKLNDGLIDLSVVRDTTRKNLLNLFPKIFNGDHIYSDLLDYRQVTDFSIIPDEHDALNIDGEILGSTPIHVTMQRDAFSIFIDQNYELD
ncbi:MAG: diacylglycerol kinase family lipid kinase [Candidatus Marinimicrobia bacterium]|nr:diacylglycerol kinase family lipid kinase [Candidatus Neomarinimicrobiota bacterium]